VDLRVVTTYEIADAVRVDTDVIGFGRVQLDLQPGTYTPETEAEQAAVDQDLVPVGLATATAPTPKTRRGREEI
jgi:hypothetical protein